MRERESLLLLTLNEPIVGSVVNLDGQRYRIAEVIRWTGTLARLVIEPVGEKPSAMDRGAV